MPLSKFVLLIVSVVAAAAITVAGAVLVGAATTLPGVATAALMPILLVAYVVWRVIADRLRNAEDDHYDRIER